MPNTLEKTAQKTDQIHKQRLKIFKYFTNSKKTNHPNQGGEKFAERSTQAPPSPSAPHQRPDLCAVKTPSTIATRLTRQLEYLRSWALSP
jgi:hypothetical protein